MIARMMLAASVVFVSTAAASAATTQATVYKITADGIGAKIGTVTFKDTKDGLQVSPHLKGLPEGQHGFHIHVNPACGPGEQNGQKVAGLAAGGHYDPKNTGKHLGPLSNDGHLGDLPVLVVDAKGNASKPVVAPRLKVSDVKGHAIMIHAGGDNYSDQPAPLGGGGPRIACGVIK